MLNFCDFIQVFVFTTNHHLKAGKLGTNFIECFCEIFKGKGRNLKTLDLCFLFFFFFR